MFFSILLTMYFVGCFMALAVIVLLIGFAVREFLRLHPDKRPRKADTNRVICGVLELFGIIICPVLHYIVVGTCAAHGEYMVSDIVDRLVEQCDVETINGGSV